MTKTLFIILLIIICIITLVILPAQPKDVLAWNDCPLGLINDPYPGRDNNYIDTNNDGICDHSQPAPTQSSSLPWITDYNLIPITTGLTALYLISFGLSRKKIIGLTTHRKIWNILLLIFFLVCGATGILLVLRINFGLVLPNHGKILFDHVETGIAVTVVAFFHLLWHRQYFKNILNG